MNPLILDCTIRDGGYINNWQFTNEQVRECYRACSNAGIDYMEIGFRNFNKSELRKKYGETFFCDESYLNNLIGDIDGCKLAVMVTINAFDIRDFVTKTKSRISLVRVLMAYHGSKNGNDAILDMSQLRDGIKQIEQLIELGYEVSFNIGRIDKISRKQLCKICEILSQTKISYFIMADTYGSIDLSDIEILIPYVKELLKDTSIKVGFHAHDNMGNGTAKTIHSLKYGVDMIDGCILGYGRGSGNAKTELLLMDLNKNCHKEYDFIHLLTFGNTYLFHYKNCSHPLSYNIVYALSAYFGAHVSYAIEIIEKYGHLSVIDIWEFFSMLKKSGKEMFFYEHILQNMNA